MSFKLPAIFENLRLSFLHLTVSAWIRKECLSFSRKLLSGKQEAASQSSVSEPQLTPQQVSAAEIHRFLQTRRSAGAFSLGVGSQHICFWCHSPQYCWCIFLRQFSVFISIISFYQLYKPSAIISCLFEIGFNCYKIAFFMLNESCILAKTNWFQITPSTF